jgi:ethanolamine utilization protein EutM
VTVIALFHKAATGGRAGAAVEAGTAAAQQVGDLVSSHVIPRPAEGLAAAYFS